MSTSTTATYTNLGRLRETSMKTAVNFHRRRFIKTHRKVSVTGFPFLVVILSTFKINLTTNFVKFNHVVPIEKDWTNLSYAKLTNFLSCDFAKPFATFKGQNIDLLSNNTQRRGVTKSKPHKRLIPLCVYFSLQFLHFSF